MQIKWVLTDEHYKQLKHDLEYSVEPGYSADMLDGATPIVMYDNEKELVEYLNAA